MDYNLKPAVNRWIDGSVLQPFKIWGWGGGASVSDFFTKNPNLK